ncbi:terminase large subunit domain-containing protein [Myxococcus xanthus]|uniref:DNA-packaging protein n=1 Tax=Myxococcus xanthus TaxID=34 RepID=A0A7Y4IR49_MYXXA|nr:terminase family protein [Myxococcus xanthus]NOJ83450.1 DNA-packaging protein [Myxococcus xanthus]NOJ91009.1 DNA-packaging protein [Myxococcus xanthus]
MKSEAVTESGDLLEGLPILRPETHGRYSKLDRLALKLRERFGTVEGFAERLQLTPQELLTLHYEPDFSLRPVQQTPDLVDESLARWRVWLFLGGRGTGKTHGGAASVIREARQDPGARILIVGPTYTEIQKNQLEGPSGILTLSQPWFRPEHFKSKKQLVWPNGVVADYLPAAKANKFRGYGYTFEWLDEIVAWEKDPEGVFEECCRVGRGTSQRMRQLGLSSRKVITTTPAPTQLFRTILKDREGLVLSRSSTFDNAANLDAAYIRQARRAASSTVGRREFLGELAFDLDPALFRKVDWETPRIDPKKRPKEFDFIVISVDPATGEKKNADMHGIVAVGVRQESDGLDHVYVLADLSCRSPEPSKWAKTAVEALRAWEPFAKKDSRGRARAWIFAETNTGGSMVKHTIRGVAKVTVKTERARQSKAERAAPVSMLAEAGLVHMVGRHKQLEEQLAKFTGQEGGHARDDRVDALCWPIFKYVVKRRKNEGAAERAGAANASSEDSDD